IGVYEGIKMTSEITDSTVDLSGDGEIPHAVLRVGAGSIPVSPDYDAVLDFLASSAPNELALKTWISDQPEPDAVVETLRELSEDGMIMSVGEYPLADPRFAKVVVRPAAPITRVADETAAPGDDQILVNAGNGEFLASEPLVDLISAMDEAPVPVAELFSRFRDTVSADERPYADQVFEADLKSLVATGAVHVYHAE
ncbi:MAG: hypothetical protein ACRDSJ_17880, partial [Rubrobacteraceae bacterium]